MSGAEKLRPVSAGKTCPRCNESKRERVIDPSSSRSPSVDRLLIFFLGGCFVVKVVTSSDVLAVGEGGVDCLRLTTDLSDIVKRC